MNIIRTKNFEHSFAILPQEIKHLFTIQEKHFQENWRDSRLHIKQLHGLADIFSFRITRNWRVLFYFKNQTTAIFFEIANRKDVYR